MLLCVGNYFDYNPMMYLKLFNAYIRTICESDTFPNLKLVDDVKVHWENIYWIPLSVCICNYALHVSLFCYKYLKVEQCSWILEHKTISLVLGSKFKMALTLIHDYLDVASVTGLSYVHSRQHWITRLFWVCISKTEYYIYIYLEFRNGYSISFFP